MGTVHVQKVLILHDRFGMVLALEERLGPLHDHMRVVIFLDRLVEEDVLVDPAEGSFGRG